LVVHDGFKSRCRRRDFEPGELLRMEREHGMGMACCAMHAIEPHRNIIPPPLRPTSIGHRSGDALCWAWFARKLEARGNWKPGVDARGLLKRGSSNDDITGAGGKCPGGIPPF